MKIAYPVTDYIPASLLTTEGDMVVRRAVNIERMGRMTVPSFLASLNSVGYPTFRTLQATVDYYWKSAGPGGFPTCTPLALRDTGIFIGTTTRNSAGNQVISGIGFESSLIIFLAVDTTGTNLNWSIGFDNGTLRAEIYQHTNGTEVSYDNSKCIWIKRDGANHIRANVSAIGSDGFTITWVLTGVCSARFVYCCLP